MNCAFSNLNSNPPEETVIKPMKLINTNTQTSIQLNIYS